MTAELNRFGDGRPVTIATEWADLPNGVPLRLRYEGKLTVEAKAVCRPCNHGWMSRLEGVCKPDLTALILGRRHRLDVATQVQLARWAAKTTALLAAYQPASILTNRDDLEAIYHGEQAPTGWLIRIAFNIDPGDTPLHLYGTSQLAVPVGTPMPSDAASLPPNSFVATFTFGHLVISAAGGPGYDRPSRWVTGTHLPLAIWPPTSSGLAWPPLHPVISNRDELLEFHHALHHQAS